MFMSKIELDKRNRKFVAMNEYQLHQFLWKGFSGFASREESGMLYNSTLRGTRQHILVQSLVEPRWSEIQDKGVQAITKAFDPSFRESMQLRFQVTANATVDAMCSDGKRRRVPVGVASARKSESREQDLRDWLNRKFALGGARVESLEVGPPIDMNFTKSGKRSRNSIVISTVQFDGICTVENPEEFSNMHRRGIGRAKSFGCGMLMLRRC